MVSSLFYTASIASLLVMIAGATPVVSCNNAAISSYLPLSAYAPVETYCSSKFPQYKCKKGPSTECITKTSTGYTATTTINSLATVTQTRTCATVTITQSDQAAATYTSTSTCYATTITSKTIVTSTHTPIFTCGVDSPSTLPLRARNDQKAASLYSQFTCQPSPTIQAACACLLACQTVTSTTTSILKTKSTKTACSTTTITKTITATITHHTNGPSTKTITKHITITNPKTTTTCTSAVLKTASFTTSIPVLFTAYAESPNVLKHTIHQTSNDSSDPTFDWDDAIDMPDAQLTIDCYGNMHAASYGNPKYYTFVCPNHIDDPILVRAYTGKLIQSLVPKQAELLQCRLEKYHPLYHDYDLVCSCGDKRMFWYSEGLEDQRRLRLSSTNGTGDAWPWVWGHPLGD